MASPRGSKRRTHRIDRFGHASKNSKRALAATARGVSARLVLLLFRLWNQAGFASLLEPATFAADVHGRRMMQQAMVAPRSSSGR
jgi:hypothetical protein